LRELRRPWIDTIQFIIWCINLLHRARECGITLHRAKARVHFSQERGTWIVPSSGSVQGTIKDWVISIIVDRVSNQLPNATVCKGSFRQCSNSGIDSDHSRQCIARNEGSKLYYYILLHITTVLLPHYYQITTALLQ
jgi:hypothetical protein